MKKLFIVLAALFITTSVFATEYIVLGVTGKVTFSDSAKGKAKTVTNGQVLSDDTILTIAANSKIVLSFNDSEITLRTPTKATVAELISAKMGIAGNAKKGKGTATAASRASDVMAEGELDD